MSEVKEKLTVKGFWKKLVNAGDNLNKDSFSARKIAALIGIITGVVLSFKYCNADVLDYIVTIWLTFALLCLGIITIEQVITLKNGNSTQQQSANEETKP